MKTEPMQPIKLQTPPQPVSENLQKFLEKIVEYKSNIINTQTLKDNNPSNLTKIQSQFSKDAKVLVEVIYTQQIPNTVSDELKAMLIDLLPIIKGIGGANSAIPRYWIGVLLLDFPFIENTEHVIRQLHKNSTQPIDINDGDDDTTDEEDDEWTS